VDADENARFVNVFDYVTEAPIGARRRGSGGPAIEGERNPMRAEEGFQSSGDGVAVSSMRDAVPFLAGTYVNGTGDIPRARKVYEGLQEERAINVNSSTGNIAALIGHRVYLDVIDRHFADALKARDVPLANTPEARLRQLEARVGIQVLAGEGAAARLECQQARALLEARLAERSEDQNSLIALAWA
jgi:hypothetical protein